MFSDVAASAICKKMGYDGSTSTWESRNLWDSVQQSYDIALDNVYCQTDNFAECTYETSDNCGHSEDVYLTCGRWRCRVETHDNPRNSMRLLFLG